MNDIYTARVNSKIRMYIKPTGQYPYILEDIIEIQLIEIQLIEIDEQHYGDG